MKKQINIAKIKEQPKKTQVQINKEKIGKLSEKEFRVKMIQNLENAMEKMQESINTFNKHLSEIKNKQRQTMQLLKLEILYKESIAEYLRQNGKVS